MRAKSISQPLEHAPVAIIEPRIQTCQLPRDATDTFKGSQYAIVGVYADAGPQNFVRHTALLKERCELTKTIPVEVLHVGPPIVADTDAPAARSRDGQCCADVLGDLLLSESECDAVKDWLAGVTKENRSIELKPFEQYRILPHMKWVLSEEGRRIRRRFSCAGFVIEAYREVGIELLDLESLPAAGEDLLRAAYPTLIELENRDPRIQARVGFVNRSDLGLVGDGPWRIALPGYLFHSTARATDSSPRLGQYTPSSVAEACFPVLPEDTAV